MTTLIHHSPLGALRLPGLGQIPPGEPFEAPPALAKTLLEQDELFHLAGPDRPVTVAELREQLAAAGLDTTGIKAVLTERLAEHEAAQHAQPAPADQTTSEDGESHEGDVTE